MPVPPEPTGHLSGPVGLAIPQYGSEAVPSYPEGNEPACTCVPGKPCADADCDACWRIAGCVGRDAPVALAREEALDEAVAAACALWSVTPHRRTTHWCVCQCTDDQHARADAFMCDGEAEARAEKYYTPGGHLVTWERVVLTGPAEVTS